MTEPAATHVEDFTQELNYMGPYGNCVGLATTGRQETGPVPGHPVVKYRGFHSMIGELPEGKKILGIELRRLTAREPTIDEIKKKSYIHQVIGKFCNGVTLHIVKQDDGRYVNLMYKAFGLGEGRYRESFLTTIEIGERYQAWPDMLIIWRRSGRVEFVRIPNDPTQMLCLEQSAYIQIRLNANTHPESRPVLHHAFNMLARFMDAANKLAYVHENHALNLDLYEHITVPLLNITAPLIDDIDKLAAERSAFMNLGAYLIEFGDKYAAYVSHWRIRAFTEFIQHFGEFAKFF